MKRKIGTIAVLTIMCVLFASTAMAARKNFNFALIPGGESRYTAKNAKSDNEGYAFVTVNNANLIEKDRIRYVVCKAQSSQEVSKVLTCNGITKPYKQALEYNGNYAKKGKEYRLRITTYNYSVGISGVWNS